MKNIYTFLFFGLLLLSCSDDVSDNEVFSSFTIDKSSLIADGQSSAEASIILNSDADSDRRNVVFKIVNGIFVGTTDPSTTTVKAEYLQGKLTAKVSFKSTTQSGIITVSAQPEFDSPIGEFKQSKEIPSTFSAAASLDLQTSAFGIFSNHLNEVQLTGTFRSSLNKPVSNGHRVIFVDTLLDGTPANGQFRNLMNTSDSASKVSAYYSAANYPIGTQINITCTLLNEDGSISQINDDLTLTINQ